VLQYYNKAIIFMSTHRMPQGSIQWQGTQRRACGPGANWNVQVHSHRL